MRLIDKPVFLDPAQFCASNPGTALKLGQIYVINIKLLAKIILHFV